jgi:hypothetical protein
MARMACANGSGTANRDHPPAEPLVVVCDVTREKAAAAENDDCVHASLCGTAIKSVVFDATKDVGGRGDLVADGC